MNRILKNKFVWISFAVPVFVSLVVLALFFVVLYQGNGEVEYQAEVFSQVPRFENLLVPMALIDELYDEYEYEEPPPVPVSRLTGLPLDEEYINRRPYAVVINNIRRAMPHSGIIYADIVYEVLAEGDVTRLIAIFQSYLPMRIGPVRSARDYFVDFAFNHDSILVFHGGSEGGYRRIRSLAINNMDGMALEGSVFYRHRQYPYWSFNTGQRPMEHSSYTGRERIAAHMATAGFRDYMNEYYGYGFVFGNVPYDVESLGEVGRVSVPFSTTYTRIFAFEPEYNHYLVSNPQGPVRDAETAEQMIVSNVLIQLTSMTVIDAVGRRNVTTVGEGRGYLVRDGEHFPVRWVKDGHTSPTRWYFESGEPVVLTPGRTWVCIFQSSGTVRFEE